jgi:hypothetical protein
MIASKRPRRFVSPLSFDDAFDLCIARANYERALQSEPHAQRARKFQRMINGIDLAITPATKRAALDAERPILTEALRFIRSNGVPTNLSVLVNHLQSVGATTRPYASGRSSRMSDRRIREILAIRLGLHGQPGRKRK